MTPGALAEALPPNKHKWCTPMYLSGPTFFDQRGHSWSVSEQPYSTEQNHGRRVCVSQYLVLLSSLPLSCPFMLPNM